MFTDVSSVQLHFVVDAGHNDHTHANQRVVVGVGGDQTHLWKGMTKGGFIHSLLNGPCQMGVLLSSQVHNTL